MGGGINPLFLSKKVTRLTKLKPGSDPVSPEQHQASPRKILNLRMNYSALRHEYPRFEGHEYAPAQDEHAELLCCSTV